MSLNDLLFEMELVFDQPMGKVDLHHKFISRKWKKEESFHEYWHDKIILGNRVPIKEDELVEYLIEGIPPKNLRNQARMHSFSNIREILKAFKKISLISENDRRNFNTIQRNETSKKSLFYNTKENNTSSMKSIDRKIVRCYSCNGTGHYSKDCTEKEKRIEEKSGKKSKNSAKQVIKQQVGSIQEKEEIESACSTDDQDINDETNVEEEEICLIDLEQKSKDNYQELIYCDALGINSFSCFSQIDTGCPISLIKKQLIDDKIVEKPGCEWNKYFGINKSKLEIIGIVRMNIILNNERKSMILGVVNNETMCSNVLLGRDALKLFGYRLTKYMKYDKEVQQIYNINIDNNQNKVDQIHINSKISVENQLAFKNIFIEY